LTIDRSGGQERSRVCRGAVVSYDASIDHELLRNLLLNANVGYSLQDYEGIKQIDKNLGVGIGAKYMMNRYFYGSIEYRYRQRESNVTPGFKSNTVAIRLEAQL